MFFNSDIFESIVDPLNRIDDVTVFSDQPSSYNNSTNYTLVLNMNKNKYEKFVALFNGLVDMSVSKNGDQVTVTCWSYKDQQLIMRWSEQND